MDNSITSKRTGGDAIAGMTDSNLEGGFTPDAVVSGSAAVVNGSGFRRGEDKPMLEQADMDLIPSTNGAVDGKKCQPPLMREPPTDGKSSTPVPDVKNNQELDRRKDARGENDCLLEPEDPMGAEKSFGPHAWAKEVPTTTTHQDYAPMTKSAGHKRKIALLNGTGAETAQSENKSSCWTVSQETKLDKDKSQGLIASNLVSQGLMAIHSEEAEEMAAFEDHSATVATLDAGLKTLKPLVLSKDSGSDPAAADIADPEGKERNHDEKKAGVWNDVGAETRLPDNLALCTQEQPIAAIDFGEVSANAFHSDTDPEQMRVETAIGMVSALRSPDEASLQATEWFAKTPVGGGRGNMDLLAQGRPDPEGSTMACEISNGSASAVATGPNGGVVPAKTDDIMDESSCGNRPFALIDLVEDDDLAQTGTPATEQDVGGTARVKRSNIYGQGPLPETTQEDAKKRRTEAPVGGDQVPSLSCGREATCLVPKGASVPVQGEKDTADCGWSESDSEASANDENLNKNDSDRRSASFNMKLLRDCMVKGKAALDDIAEKHVALVLGRTGAGKSTFIQGIAGKELKQSIYQTTSTGQTVAKAVFESIDGLPGFEIGHAKKSMTKFIRCFVPPNDGTKPDIVYMDSPGFEDTDGPEIDIATSVMINHVVKRCRTLRLVFLINYASLLDDRGGSVRTILKLIRNFASSFSANKTSCMFLFTHTHEIKQIPEELCGARECLMKELVRTAEGTNRSDSDVTEILEHMIKCLRRRESEPSKRRYQIVDVIHPIKTDFAQIKITLEGMKPLQEKFVAGNCGLSQHLQLKLAAGLETSLCRARLLINQAVLKDSNEVNELWETAIFLGQYVDIENVRKAVAQFTSLAEKHSNAMRKAVEEETHRGTTMGFKFNSSNIKALKASLSQVQWFSKYTKDESITQEIFSHVDSQVRAYHQHAMLGKDGSWYADLPAVLGNLRTWSEGFEQFASFYTQARRRVVGLLESDCKFVALFYLNDLAAISHDSLMCFVERLHDLEQLGAVLDRLSEHGVNVALVRTTILNARNKVIKSVELLASASREVRQDSLDKTAHAVHKLEFFMGLVNSRLSFSSKFKDVYLQNLYSISEDVFNHFSRIFASLKGKIADFDSSWQKPLTDIRTHVDLFKDYQGGRWKEIQLEYRSLLSYIQNIVGERIKKLELKAQEAKCGGMRQGEADRKEFMFLESSQWLDDFLLPDLRFIVRNLDKIKNMFQERIEFVSREVECVLASLFDKSCDSRRALLNLRDHLFPELRQIAVFLNQEESIPSRLFDDYAKGIEERAASSLGEWRSTAKQWENELCKPQCGNKAVDLHQALVKAGHGVHGMLSEIELLLSVDPNYQLEGLKKASKEICSTIQEVSQSLDKIFTFKGRYLAKAYALSFIYELESYKAIPLIGLEALKNKGKQSLEKHANEIESMVSANVDTEKINAEIAVLEKAIKINRFLSNEVSARLERLQSLRVQKEEGVERQLQEFIKIEDYHSMIDLLQPYASASAHSSQSEKLGCMASSALLEILESAKGLLSCHRIDRETVQRVALCVEILEAAQKKLGCFVTHKGLDIPRDITKLRETISKVFEAKIRDMKVAGDRFDFFGLGISKIAVTAFAESTLRPRFQDRSMKAAVSIYEKAVASVSTHLDEFFDSCLASSSPLLGDLTSLKQARNNEAPRLEELAEQYERMQRALVQRLNKNYCAVSQDVEERQCFDEAITWMHRLDQCSLRGLQDHVSLADLSIDCKARLEEWRTKKINYDRELNFERSDAEAKLDIWARSLDQLHPKSKWSIAAFLRFSSVSSYERLCHDLEVKISHFFAVGKASVQTSKDLQLAQENIALLDLISTKVGKHIATAAERLDQLKKVALDAFLSLCSEAQRSLESGGIRQFQRLFPDYRSFVVHVPYILSSTAGKEAFSATNKLVYQILDSKISDLKVLLDSFEFLKIKEAIESLRIYGGFVADRFSLLREEIENSDRASVDRWLEKVQSLCVVHFSSGRDLGRIKHFATLGLPPSASSVEIAEAFTKVKNSMKDSAIGASCSSEVHLRATKRKVEEAISELRNRESPNADSLAQPFDNMLHGISDALRETVRGHLKEQKYDLVEQLLFKLDGLGQLDKLVSPPLDASQICQSIITLVKKHVDGVRVDVNTNWSERKFRYLNDSIADLKNMQSSFKSYSNIFPASLDTGVFRAIEGEIEALGVRARGYLKDKQAAKQQFDDFRRCFVRLGFVLDELAWFRPCTKTVMSSVLESCLDTDWGHSFLFELGLSLQRGDENAGPEEHRICQMIVGEFSHFNEVQTMVWNEETCQKPADDTVHDICGRHCRNAGSTELKIDANDLLKSFWIFEEAYKTFLADYLNPDSNIHDLVHTIIQKANKLKPVNLDIGWGATVKENLPTIAAGVFAVFTVIKSSVSYNRIDDEGLGEKILMKPHNIQILTILCMLGCGDPSNSSLESQVMQIRTGEGKSLILGATAVILALLGFRVRCICYSEYLSSRDYDLFKDLFGYFQLTDCIRYSKITTLSEENTKSKGDIRKLTESLLNGQLAVSSRRTLASDKNGMKQEILIVDEFDVFFGSDFYGKTYNQVVQLRDPQIAEILKCVWSNHKGPNCKQMLSHIQSTQPYQELINKYKGFSFLIDNEIALMIEQVRQSDEEPYYLDKTTDRIGYKVMDTIEYEVTYGYCTMFAYLREADKGNLKHTEATLAKALAMPVSCGQFSYANITAIRIMGVSGTVEAMGNYEKNVLSKYGIERFVYIPSVYGQSNFQFDVAGDGIYIESTTSDFFHKITDVILDVSKEKRAVIVFFRNDTRLREYKGSSFYHKLGRHVKLLTEDMDAADKSFVVKKAATAGQITLCTSVFGRGTDFFCKDDLVQKNGGVHIIQTFLSEALSEQLQIKGRTARQGKKESYQMILLETDLETDFEIKVGEKDKIAREDRYEWLSCARKKKHESHCHVMDANLENATEKDKKSHALLNALLKGDKQKGHDLFKELYFTVKTQSLAANTEIDLAFVIDVTGSMGPYTSAIFATVKTLVDKQGAVMGRLQANYPDTEFTFHVAVMGFRDIDDGNAQFRESLWKTKSHFTENTEEAIRFVRAITNPTSGGGDLAEDVLGAIDRCARWNEEEDWKSRLKFMMVLTDAPAHGLVDPSVAGTPNTDDYATSHPKGLTTDSVVDVLVKRGIDLFMCSFNPTATSRTEQEISKKYRDHPNNRDQREATLIPLVPSTQHPGASDPNVSYNRHIIFVLDESGSMCNDWNGVVVAYNQYLARRQQYQCDSDLVSVVQFAHASRATVQQCKIRLAPRSLYYGDGGTNFGPAAASACTLARATPPTHVPVVVFMSDGEAFDACQARSCFMSLNSEIRGRTGRDLELHVIAFRSNASQAQLAQIASASSIGKVRASSDTTDLTKVFEEIAGGANVAGLLEAEIGKRVSEAVGNKLALEFMG
ncbi:hypothetical protein ACA910_009286 [Epithemia clementina (nom. ined.)]